MTRKEHLTGLALVVATILVLTIIPLVNADVRSGTGLPFGDALRPQHNEQLLLVFAGFPGCAGVCPTVMNQLAATRRILDERYTDAPLGVAFVNLHLDATDQSSARYAAAFHPAFQGFSTPSARRGELKSVLAQTGSRNPRDLSYHRGNVYLFERNHRDWVMTKVFARLPPPDQLANDMAALLSANASEANAR